MPRMLIICMVIITMLFVSSCAKRNTAYQDKDGLSLITSVPVVGNPLDLNYVGEKLYVALDQGGLGIINLANYSLQWFTKLTAGDGTVTTLLKIRKVGVVPERNYMFLNETQGTDLVYIIDSANPDSLKPFDAITGASQDIQDMVCKNLVNAPNNYKVEILYCNGTFINYGRFNGDLWLGSDFSINAPASVSGVTMDDTYIYAAAQQRGLLIYRRSNRQLVSETPIPGEAQKIHVEGNIAYIASRQKGLQILDITDPTNPVYKGGYVTTGYASGVDFYNGKVAVSSGSGGAYLIDVSNPSSPKLLHRITDCGYVNTVKFTGNRLAVASRDNGILFYQVN